MANIDKMKKDGDESSMLTSIALRNPCITPLDLLVRLEHYIKELFANQKSRKNQYIEKIIPQARNWILGQITSDVYSAILRDDSVLETTWKKYTDHVKAYVHNTTVKHEVTHADAQPDEKFMQAIEQYLGNTRKRCFQKRTF